MSANTKDDKPIKILRVVTDEDGEGYRWQFIIPTTDGSMRMTSALYYVQEEFSELLIDMMQFANDFLCELHHWDTETKSFSSNKKSPLQSKPEFTPSFENGGYRWQLEALYGENIIKLKSQHIYIIDELGTAVIDDLSAVWLKFIEQQENEPQPY